MLRQRVATALVLAPLVIFGVLLLPTLWFACVLGLVLLVAAAEWATLSGLQAPARRAFFLVVFAFALAAVGWLSLQDISLTLLMALTSAWWLWIAVRLARTRRIEPSRGVDSLGLAAGFLVLLTTLSALVWLHALTDGPYLVMFFLFLIWIADTGAYFAGRRFGRTKLAPVVSPGKTIEGVYGALAGGLLWGGVLAVYHGGSSASALGLVLLCLVTVLASIAGDLYESLLKRERDLKDSGILLPGHGGMLDRIDSVTAAAPVFAFGYALLERVT